MGAPGRPDADPGRCQLVTRIERRAKAADLIAKAIQYNAPVDWQGPRMDNYALIWGRIAADVLDREGILCALHEETP